MSKEKDWPICAHDLWQGETNDPFMLKMYALEPDSIMLIVQTQG